VDLCIGSASAYRCGGVSAIGVSVFLVLAMVPAILLREVDYTLDARTYIELFQTWCTSGYAGREGFTFANLHGAA